MPGSAVEGYVVDASDRHYDKQVFECAEIGF